MAVELECARAMG